MTTVRPMRRHRARHAALTSSMALLLGAGFPLEQVLAQTGQSRPTAPPAGAGVTVKTSSGFEMVTGPVPPEATPNRTSGLPARNGFEMLPESAGADSAETSARKHDPATALVPLPMAMAPAADAASLATPPVPGTNTAETTAFDVAPQAGPPGPQQPVPATGVVDPHGFIVLTPMEVVTPPAATVARSGGGFELSPVEPAPSAAPAPAAVAFQAPEPAAPPLPQAVVSAEVQPSPVAAPSQAPVHAQPAPVVAIALAPRAAPSTSAAPEPSPAPARQAPAAPVAKTTVLADATPSPRPAPAAPATPAPVAIQSPELLTARTVAASEVEAAPVSMTRSVPAAFTSEPEPQQTPSVSAPPAATTIVLTDATPAPRPSPAAPATPAPVAIQSPELLTARTVEASEVQPAPVAVTQSVPATLASEPMPQPAPSESAPPAARTTVLADATPAPRPRRSSALDSGSALLTTPEHHQSPFTVAFNSVTSIFHHRHAAPPALATAPAAAASELSVEHAPDVQPALAEAALAEPVRELPSQQLTAQDPPALIPISSSTRVMTLAQQDAPPPVAAAPAPPPPAPRPSPPAAAAPTAPTATSAATAPSPAPSAAQPIGPTGPTGPVGAPGAPAAPPAPAPLPVVSRIIVQGNERIEPSTILSYLPIQVGEPVDNARIDLAVKTLFRTDLFADVAMEMQGADLIVKVSENPIINQVVFEGNHSLKEDKLRDEVTIRPRGIFTRSRVEQDVQRIIELYRRSGRISATVTPKIVQLPQKRVDLIFEIDEGPKSGILQINFIGNKSYGDNALRDVIVTRESHWYKFFQSNDNYDPDRLEYDREQLRKFYRNHGYYDFRIISAVAELAPDKNGFAVTFTIDEGPKYHFGKLKVQTELKRLNGDLLQALLPIREGQLYEDDRIEKATDSLTYAAGANGFAFVDIRPRYVAHPETRTVDVTFDIKEGPRVYIERIDVVGNTQTLDRVIRREMRVSEGDAYNRVLVDRSKNQIRGLGFFKDVDIEQLPGSAPDKTVLRVKVTEQPTGQLTFSLGYSSVEKLVGDVGISQSNFRGRGQRVDFEVSLGYLRKQITLSFTEPRFMDRNLAAGFDIYTYRYDFSTQASFQTASTGISLRTGFPINQYASIGTTYSVHTDNVSIPSYVIDPATGKCTQGYSQSLCDEIGRTLTSLVGYSVRWDRRNDPILPTRGFYVDFRQDFAGLGGDTQYISTNLNGAWYYGITPAWIVSVQGFAGYITGWGGDLVRINDRFFRGGDTFRGFQYAGIGPRDTSQTSTSGASIGDALGGKAYAIGTVELTVPTPIPAQYGIKTSLFTDVGTLGLLDDRVKRNPDGTFDPFIKDNLALRASAGVSVKWKSPMGPLVFDFSKVLKKAPYDRTETFRFSTTTRF